MNATDDDGAANQDKPQYVFKVCPRLSVETAQCCVVRVLKGATAASVIQSMAEALGLDMSKRYALAEVRECGGKEWVLEASDLPVQRLLLWPRKVQLQHSPSQGYYFILQDCEQDGSPQVQSSPAGGERECQRLATRGFLPPEQEDFDDLCNLPILTEDSILVNLRLRFQKEKIYTYAGSILIAINPFKFLPIYNPKYVKKYENHQLGKLSPHAFAIADVVYHTMLKKQVDQCIVISGESGSGKTQSTNFLIHCLTALSQKGFSSGVERTILGASPVLEAFGNAKTAHNDNSSRFGKFIQVNYLESGVVRGAVVEKYLLEKSRLVSRKGSERNYHVFYYLLAGASEEERRDLKLLPAEEYAYLTQDDCPLADEADLRHEYNRLRQAMEMVGFLPPTRNQIFSVLSAILHLGNVTYTSTGDDKGLVVGPPHVLSALSELLEVKEKLLVEALTKRKSTTANDTLILPFTLREAITARDSMAKSLYSSLFDWIVLRINHALLNKRDMEEAIPCLSIGVLDIFGFEDFKTNSFEQFCINYANEELHCYFNRQIFKLEQEEYLAEGISWHNIDYTDNKGCIHLISKKPTGLFHLLDEESNFHHATDDTLLEKFKQQHRGNPFFLPTSVKEPAFVIQHFAGKVKYEVKGFREKNTDHMRRDIVALLRSSGRVFLRQLIGTDPVAVFRWGILRATVRSVAAFIAVGRRCKSRPRGSIRRQSGLSVSEMQRKSSSQRNRLLSRSSLLDFSFDHSEEHPLEVFEDIFASFEKKKKNKGSKSKQLIPKNLTDSTSLKFIVGLTLHDSSSRSLLQQHNKKKTPSISAQFQASLNKLLETLGRAEPFFIHCILSNAQKKEMTFDESLVLQQLRYTGMLDTVRIRRSGYSTKYTFKEFTTQFRVLMPKDASTPHEDISHLLQNLGLEKNTYQIGKTKVFLKETARQQLHDTLHKEVMRSIITLQRWFRLCLLRKHFLSKRDAARIIQRSWRSIRAEYRCRAATMIQAMWRGSQQREDFLRKRASVKKMQALVRENAARRRSELGWKKGEEDSNGRSDEEEGKTKDVQGPESNQKGHDVTSALPKAEGERSRFSQLPNPPATVLRRQLSLECYPEEARSTEGSAPKINGQERSNNEKESREDGVSPHVLTRPFSMPLDTGRDSSVSANASNTGSLQRNNKPTIMREKAEKWRERRSEGILLDRPRPESTIFLKDKRTEGLKLQHRGKSMSLDNVSKFSSSESDSSSPTSEVRVRTRKCQRRRLAQARSGLLVSRGGQDVEYWSSPLLPSSPTGQNWSSDCVPDDPDGEFKPTTESCADGSKVNKLKQDSNGSTAHLDTHQSHPASSEKVGFLSKFLKRRKEVQVPEEDRVTMAKTGAEQGSEATSPLHRPNPMRRHSQLIRPHPTIQISRATRVSQEWNESLERKLTNTNELRHLDDFLGNQVNELQSRGKQLSGIENIFLTATMQFRDTIKSMYSLQQKQHTGYKGLMKCYQDKVISLAGPKQMEDVPLVVNLFQSVLDGFIRGELKRGEVEPMKPTKVHKKRRNKDICPDSPLDHRFTTYQVNIMQSCDICGSYIWGMEKASMCSACRLVCHKKCLSKINKACSTRNAKKVCVMQYNGESGNLNFGVPVCALTSLASPVPVVMEMMLEHVEMTGLYTEGIYRKSGSACRARELHQLLESDPKKTCLENFSIHTITGLIKQWLRELPDPLMTFNLYNDFLHTVELPEKSQQIRAIYQKLEELPTPNYSTLERLIFHLVRVANEEEHNRMSPNSLAIVFAPCILRCPDTSDPFLSMKDISKTTMCVETLISEQVRRYNEKLQEIKELELAESLAFTKLKLRRQNTILESTGLHVPSEKTTNSDREERTLIERIRSIKKEKEDLTCRLPELEQEVSDDDTLDSMSSLGSESFYDDYFRSLEAEGRSTAGPKLQVPEIPSKPPDLSQNLKGLSRQQAGEDPGYLCVAAEKQQGHHTEGIQSSGFSIGQNVRPVLKTSRNTTDQPATLMATQNFSGLDIPFIDDV